jgi:hypothetical protein|tara:strand:- start:233 stop:526 length:294 start_codon:yes stop_codon:yes gene_type:complete
MSEARRNESAPSTKKLKSILKLLNEYGVSHYKDSEVEIELVGLPPQMAQTISEDFSFDRYDEEAPKPEKESKRKLEYEPVDDLGNTDTDYLYWSANE